jgi:hypothetical protein
MNTTSKLIAKIARYADLPYDVMEAVHAVTDNTATEEQIELLKQEEHPERQPGYQPLISPRPVSKTYARLAAHQWSTDPESQRVIVQTKTSIGMALVHVAILMDICRADNCDDYVVEAIDNYIYQIYAEKPSYTINGVKFN